MPLVIHLKKDQQIIVNGAVLQNVSGRTVSVAVRNEAAILRDSDVLPPEGASTPASRAYFALQCAYLFPDQRAESLVRARELLAAYLDAAPSAAPICASIETAVGANKLYEALKKGRLLLAHERERVAGD